MGFICDFHHSFGKLLNTVGCPPARIELAIVDLSAIPSTGTNPWLVDDAHWCSHSRSVVFRFSMALRQLRVFRMLQYLTCTAADGSKKASQQWNNSRPQQLKFSIEIAILLDDSIYSTFSFRYLIVWFGSRFPKWGFCFFVCAVIV